MFLKGIFKSYRVTVAALFVAAVTAGITFRYNIPLACVELAAVCILLLLGYFHIFRKFRQLHTQVDALNDILTFDKRDNEKIEGFPMPVALCSSDGEILWFNNAFESVLIDECALTEDNMNEYLQFSLLTQELLPQSLEADVNGNFFTVYPQKLDGEVYVLYFAQDTALKNFRNAYLKSRPAVLLINIDSLDNTEDTYSHIDYSTIHADIDRIISAWLASNHCVFRRYSDGRYFALTEYENLEHMAEKRFDLLDLVRNYRYEGQDSGITLSVGIGREPTFGTCENSARQALDMARGRGGDQVAIKVGDSFEFFGGISARKEKRGKIKSRTVATALCEMIEKADQVLLMGHAFSDFDCVGSQIGVAAIAAACGIKTAIVVNDETTLAGPLIENCKHDGLGGLFISREEALARLTENTLLVVTDILRPNNVESKELLNNAAKIAVIDHHRMPVDRIEQPALLFHDPNASSASEMVTELIQYAPCKPKLSPVQAEALLAGIILDTKNFSMRVGVRTFEAAAFLRDRKSDTVRVKKLFAYSEEENLTVNKIVLSAKICDSYAVAFTDHQAADMRKLCSQAADDLLDIKGVEASFVAYKQGNGVGISARSLGSVNVHLIMEKLGGGGHQSMAGAQLRDTAPKDAMLMLSRAIQEYFSTNV